MIQCTCLIAGCFTVANYHSPITREQSKKNPPFQNMPLVEGEDHQHVWEIKEVEEIKLGR